MVWSQTSLYRVGWTGSEKCCKLGLEKVVFFGVSKTDDQNQMLCVRQKQMIQKQML